MNMTTLFERMRRRDLMSSCPQVKNKPGLYETKLYADQVAHWT